MGLIRLLLLVAAAWLLWHFWRAARRRARAMARSAPPAVERMARCAQCGLHVPEREAIGVGEPRFCCEAHRLAHRAAHGPDAPRREG